jgi:hypothetical protein
MALKEVLQQFLNDVEWKDEIVHDDGDDTDFVSTGLQIDGQRFRLILITAEKGQTIRVLLVSPITIPKPRAREAAVVLNSLNLRIRFGNLEMDDEGAVYYRWGMDIEGATAGPRQFRNLIDAGTSAFDELHCAAIGAAAFTRQPAREIIKAYTKAVEKSDAEPNETNVH